MNQDERDFWDEVTRLVTTPLPLTKEYRLYYDNNDDIVMLSMQDHPPGDRYLIVDEQVYNNYHQYCVQNGQLKKIDKDILYHVQLTTGTNGYRVVKNHAGIVLEPGESYPETEYYDHRNH